MAIDLPDTQFVASGVQPVQDQTGRRLLSVTAPAVEQAMVGIRENQLSQGLENMTLSIDRANNERIAQFSQQEAEIQEQMAALDDQNMNAAESQQLFRLNEQLRRLRSAADQGIFTDDELQARTNTLVRQFTRRTPAFAEAYRMTAAEFLGRAEPTLDNRSAQLIQTAKDARELEEQIQRQLQERGLPDTLRSRYLMQQAFQTKFNNERFDELAAATGRNDFETRGRAWISNMNLESVDLLAKFPETLESNADYETFRNQYLSLKAKWTVGLNERLAFVTDPERRAALTTAFERATSLFEDENGMLSAADLSRIKQQESSIIQSSLSMTENQNALALWENAPTLMRIKSVAGDGMFNGLMSYVKTRNYLNQPSTRASFPGAEQYSNDLEAVFGVLADVVEGTDTGSPEVAEVSNGIWDELWKGLHRISNPEQAQAYRNVGARASDSGSPYTIKGAALATQSAKQALREDPTIYRRMESNAFTNVLPRFTQLGEELDRRGITDVRVVIDPTTKSVALVDGENRLIGRSDGDLKSPTYARRDSTYQRNKENFFSQFTPMTEPRRVTAMERRAVVPDAEFTLIEPESMNVLMYMLGAHDDFQGVSQFETKDEIVARLLGELRSE